MKKNWKGLDVETVDYRKADLGMNGKKSETGYDESDFTEDYWLEDHEVQGARIDKDAGLLIRYLKDLFRLFGEGSVLDVGAGAGNVVRQLREAGIEAEGCEFSASGRKLAMERFGVNLEPFDLRDRIPRATNFFDYTVCFGVLSMIPMEYMQYAISEMARVTKKATLVCVQTQAGGNSNVHHITSLSRGGYYDLFKKAGLDDVTSILPPQGRDYGIGIGYEFCGLFMKK